MFDVMKAAARRMFEMYIQTAPEAKLNKPLAAQFLIRGWEMVNPQVLEKARSVCFDAPDEEGQH
jgi:hypothetical protein